jgi:urease accessory protein
MKRAQEVKPAGQWDSATAVDRIMLDAHDRHRRRVALTGEGGTTFLLTMVTALCLTTAPWCASSAVQSR